MATLLLRLAGPMQAWGDSSRFTRRHTRLEPTKSGVLGLIAAAKGMRRTDPIEDPLELSFGVRVDQPGRLVRDFQTAIRWHPKKESMPLSYRYYLSDAVFVAGVSGERSLLEGIDEALRSPTYPPFLGRRSCPPSQPISMGVVDTALESSLRDVEWQAGSWHRRDQASTVELDLVLDAGEDEPDEMVRDVPQSWDPVRRGYGWRPVKRAGSVTIDNPVGRRETDFFAVVAGS